MSPQDAKRMVGCSTDPAWMQRQLVASDEKAALEWLDLMAGETDRSFAPARTLKAMLQRPVMPEEPDYATWNALRAGWANISADGEGADWKAAYRALRAHLAKPQAPKTKTETFTRWLVVAPRNEYGPYAFHSEALGVALAKGGTLIELTGTGEVPA